MPPPSVCSWLAAVVCMLLVLCDASPSQGPSEDNCAGSGAKVRHLILYDLRTADAQTIATVDKLFRQRLLECDSVLYPGSSYGGAAITTTPTVYGFPPSRPMPVTATIADWVGWLDFTSLEGLHKCLKINNRTGTLRAMRSYAQPNGRIDLVIRKTTVPGNKNEPCPLPNSYAPATIRYIWAYIFGPDTNRAATCKKGAALMHRILKVASSDVRHGTACSLLTDQEARSYGIELNSGFGGYVDFESLRDMTRYLASNDRSIQSHRKQLRTLAAYAARAAIALPWSGR